MTRPRRTSASRDALRAERRHGFGPDGHARARLAQAAARLIAEHGIADWSAAKRKAARELGLPERAALPGDDEIEDALVEYQALFGGERHRAMLRMRRTEAVVWLRNLARFDARLVGAVAEGWATEHSDIRIELCADDSKAVELALLNAGVDYRTMPTRSADDAHEFCVDTPRGGVRLSTRTPGAMRARPRRDRHGREVARLDAEAVEALLKGSEP
jgi:hypothetical protein